jgi:hypothetical protein
MSRNLTPEEIKNMKKRELKFLPAKFAADAVFLLFQRFSKESISMDEIKGLHQIIKNLFLTELIPAI